MTKSFHLICPLAIAGALWLPMSINAANVSMNASDANGATTSFNGAGHWTNAQAPSPANDYFTAGFLMRSPSTGTSNYFGGNSLTIDGNPANAVVGLAMKYPSSGAVRVDDLRLNGGAVFNGQGATMSVYGNITVLTNSYLDPQANGRVLAIYAPISGGSTNTIGIRAAAGSAGGTVQILSDGSGYNGGWYIWGSGDSVPGAILQVGNGGASGSLGSGNVTNHNSLVFNRSDDIVFPNYITGGGGVVKSGAGMLTLTGLNDYSGVTTINAGVLAFGSISNIGVGSVTLNGGTLKYLPGNTADVSLYGVTLNSAGGTIDVGANNVTLLYGIGNGGTGSFTKAGTGTLVLGAPNSSSGSTIVKTGTLALGSGGSISGSPVVSIASGASLDVSAVSGFSFFPGQTIESSGTLIGNVASVSGAIVSPGGANSGTTTVNGNIVLDSSTLRLDLNAPGVVGGTNDLLVVNGNLSVSSAVALNLVFPNNTPLSGTFTLCQCTGTITGDPSALNATLGSYKVTFAFNTGASPKTITMTVAGVPQSLRWTGQNGTEWDTSSFNWTNTVGLTNSIFSPGDTVVFDDTTAQNSVTISSPVAVGDTTVDTAATYTFTGAGGIVGAGNLTKSGPGTLVLDVTNDYTGYTLVQSGVLQLGFYDGAGTFGEGPVTNSGAIVFNRSDAAGVFPNAIAGTGSITNDGSGAVTLSGDNTYAGGTTINAGTVKMGSPTALGMTNGSTRVIDGGVLDLNGQTNAAESVTISGSGVGAGALVNNRSLAAMFNGSVTLSGDAAVGGSGALVVSAPIAGGFSLTKSGNGTTTLTASNNYSGTTTISAGTLALTDSHALSGGAVTAIGALQLNGGITISGFSFMNNAGGGVNGLQVGTGSNVWSGPVMLGVNYARFGSTIGAVLNITGIVDDSGIGNGFRVRGNDGAGVVMLSAANTYLGDTSIDVGVLMLGNPQGLPATTVVGINPAAFAAVLDMAGYSSQIAGLTGVGPVINSAGTLPTLTLNTSNTRDYTTAGAATGAGGIGSNVFNGTISGNVAVAKGGDADTFLVLTKANSYTGDTTVNAGTLAISQPTLTAGSTIRVATGAVLRLDFAGSNTVAGLVLNGVSQAPGVYNAASSSPFISGAGTLVVAEPVAGNPTNIVLTVSGGTLNISWPADHLGWLLQTNAVSVGDPSSWHTYPGSASLTNVAIPVNPSKVNVYFRLAHP